MNNVEQEKVLQKQNDEFLDRHNEKKNKMLACCIRFIVRDLHIKPMQ